MANFLEKLLGDPNKKAIAGIRPLVERIAGLEASVQGLGDEALAAKTIEFKERLEKGETLDTLLPEAFAVVREAAKRVLGERHYDVQLMGGVVLHQGKIAEMKTGEGKTLVATLPVYLNALSGKGVHVVTVNDYLAKRDSEWMGRVYQFLGLTVGVVLHGMDHAAKKAAYAADITYGTNNEFGFDYLRDNMAPSLETQVQRGLNFAIVDEVDSILIDEARTPLIISAPDAESTDNYRKFARVAEQLTVGTDFTIDEKSKSAFLTEAGIDKVQKILGVKDVYESGDIVLAHHIEQALKAQALFKRDVDYVVKDGEVMIVDEFTGRLMPGRRYSEGLHQAIEAKENVEVKKESKTMATITFQNYFRLYDKLSGMTGTAKTEEEEFWKIYGLEVVTIPTNQPVVRRDLNDLIYANSEAKFNAVVEEIKARYVVGQPVLVGTIAIEKSEKIAQMLQRDGIPHQVLNAKHHEREAAIIEEAGRKGAVTIATNMAGRGTDIKLDDEARSAGGLHVLGTERHESRRIDNQLRGRSGRQGDPGSSQFFVSMEDDLMRLFGSDRIKNMMKALRIPEDQPLEHKMITGSLETAQKRVEGHNFDIRKRVVEYDDVMNRHRTTIYNLRQEILEKGEVKDEVMEYVLAEVGNSVAAFVPEAKEARDMEAMFEAVNVIFPVGEKLRDELKGLGDRQQILDRLMLEAASQYEAKEKEAGADSFRQAERAVMLRVMDILWIEHLDAMMKLREAIGLHGYGQRDPLVEYKQEGYNMFQRLQAAIAHDVARLIYKVKIVDTSGLAGKQVSEKPKKIEESGPAEPMGDFKEEEKEIRNQRVSGGQNVYSDTKSGHSELVEESLDPSTSLHSAQDDKGGVSAAVRDPEEQHEKIGRNDPCWCGSGKKYKKCHGAN